MQEKVTVLQTPEAIVSQLPLSEDARKTVAAHRQTVGNILAGKDARLLVIAGPCSIFNKKGAIEFAEKFAKLRESVSEKMELVLRAPPAKPRTVSKAGQWEGLMHEPAVVGNYDSNEGIRLSREILRDIADRGIPIGIELLDTKRTRYFDDLLSLSWTGARTVENSDLRRQASGLPWPVGFKNRTDGAVKSAIDAIESANGKNFFDSVDRETGRTIVEMSDGNPHTFLILRGGDQGPNRSEKDVSAAQESLRARNLPEFVVVDSAHGNSVDAEGKRGFSEQPTVFKNTVGLWRAGNKKIGAMMEVYLKEGKQEILPGTVLVDIPYDISPTDPCVGWNVFEALILEAAQKL